MITITKEFTKEQLIEQAKKNIEVLRVAVGRVPGAYDAAVIHLKLAEITLASLEAEPVAYIFKHPAGKLFWALTDESNKEQADVIPVYAAAPASVVPDNASEPLAYAYKELTPEIMRNQAAESNRGNEWTGNPDIDNAIIMLDRIDTLENCDDDRIEAVKAVLRRLAGNYPVTPDGWISCSERMPNDAQWCVVNTEYGYYVQCWSEGQGWLGDDISIPECDVINWMPLPEPPKEVNRG
ncbi:DUF551 domain-containing protein [Escherichia coli]|uniref:DUF551 domain-containing protein n=2 Tax=Escherichia coli TaxID=562 RepID=UPI0010AA563F|nr:DUF551 domain-containing protein [Escherichia coli]TII85615.1 DUF551 domain-containing protein [Escherichia coli]HAN8277998.1 DUF551 domain-containing protein [Escherichia coli]HBH7349549.1 DUF551 domain-containing protein [Escherichia coli]HDS0506336.1 DUF551 domain-containing protein [Escherichia coli]HDV7572336.1 DUF551 domain-containing protein [Escherichia coli]